MARQVEAVRRKNALIVAQVGAAAEAVDAPMLTASVATEAARTMMKVDGERLDGVIDLVRVT